VDIDNAMPLCFECHGALHHYNRLHPRGTRFFVAERKTRRNQIYEEYTRHLVPPIDYQMTQWLPKPPQKKRVFPDVGLTLHHLADHLPVKVFTQIAIKLGGKSIGAPPDRTYYAGEKPWRLNPRALHWGHFTIPASAAKSAKRLEVEISVTIIDMYDYPHRLLPVGWVYIRDQNDWYFEP
jgi:hypothetical protein